ncbi:hypothetical protein COT99_00740 [Candidatus Falkowbacteria bacterium CG10_big_fil_rev_8_21_14_0_10_43_10]|uniref:Polymerase nucleotidyl transferase domain-containing protein n=1 Tax=Candidatus Falkowbacteria bacterium CG10_big_fil_rev_8_21_14_0_10_43_10 TaxID=1974567 RepID=A0A2H0V303_9BACT|nr:MAG: hypothetical protein COT99_00740 [Candidatus Falkowbacteria bacterium CG10_big_fil_rev_8_21_14_0_10_43_10]
MLASTLASLRDIKFDLDRDSNVDFNHDFCFSRADLDAAIIKTLTFFDIFDYPLTDWEIYKYLWVGESVKKAFGYNEVKNALERGLPGTGREQGFYFLSGPPSPPAGGFGEAIRREIVAVRKQRQIISRKKFRRARRIIKLLGTLPFIRMIAVCNSLAYDNAREDSDIDLFIITAKGKIWTARFYAVILLKLLRLRPTAKTKKDKICLNFFISEGSLNLQPLMIQNDIYFIYWLKQLLPIYGRPGIFLDFMKRNELAGKYINNGAPNVFYNKRKVKNSVLLEGLKCMLEVSSGWAWLESLLKWAQIKIMPQYLLDKAGRGTEVVINDNALKFHIDDRRAEFRDKWQQVS